MQAFVLHIIKFLSIVTIVSLVVIGILRQCGIESDSVFYIPVIVALIMEFLRSRKLKANGQQ